MLVADSWVGPKSLHGQSASCDPLDSQHRSVSLLGKFVTDAIGRLASRYSTGLSPLLGLLGLLVRSSARKPAGSGRGGHCGTYLSLSINGAMLVFHLHTILVQKFFYTDTMVRYKLHKLCRIGV